MRASPWKGATSSPLAAVREPPERPLACSLNTYARNIYEHTGVPWAALHQRSTAAGRWDPDRLERARLPPGNRVTGRSGDRRTATRPEVVRKHCAVVEQCTTPTPCGP